MATDSLPIRQCLQCEQEKRIHARGLCQNCYSKTWARENPERYRAIAARKYEKNREKDNARSRRYYAKNRESVIVQQRARDLLRLEEKREYNRLYQNLHRDELREYHREYSKTWNTEHPERVREYLRKYHQSAKGRRMAVENNRRRRARKNGTPLIERITPEQWEALKAEFAYRCAWCELPGLRLTMDHIQPLSKGGSHSLVNIVPSCKPCNSFKRDKFWF